jgi:2-polyprenyl-3-methyl-5-hydroxy-6-metoxy-1,4-benzoquinol methylase
VNHLQRFGDIGGFIADVRESILAHDRTHQHNFDIYANEARFGLSVIEDDLSHLAPGAEIMEIGAGMLLLSGYLAQKGFRVHALEPIGEGFSLLRTLQSAVLRHYENNGVQLKLIESAVENISDAERFDYVFSINVFEHIGNIERGLVNSYLSLRVGGVLRVYCPNYLFPYEPHFNIPTLVSKRLTEFVFKGLIVDSSRISQAKEVWGGLNWINTVKVRQFFRKNFNKEPVFNHLAVYQIMKRVLDDQQYRERRPGWVASFLKVMNRIGLMGLFKLVPVTFSPVMDFRMQRGGP